MKKAILILIPTIILGGLIFWRVKSKTGAEGQLKGAMNARKSPAVEVAPAGPAVIASSMIAAGNLDSPFKVQLTTRTTGRINSISVREGDSVTAGQVLVKIDPASAIASLTQAEANLAQAKSRLAQAKIESAPNTASVKGQVDQQKANLQNAKAELAQTQKSVDSTVSSLTSAVNDAQAKVDTSSNAVDTAKANLDKEKATLRNLQVKADRAKDLLEKGYIARKDWEDATTALDVQEKQVQVATANLAAAQTSLRTAKNQFNQAKTQLDIAKSKGQADISASKAKVAQAQSSLTVANANTAMNPAYQENINALKAAVNVAQAQVDQARVQVSETDLRSSINGVITARNADEGTLASPGTAVLVIESLDWLFFVASIPVEMGDKVRVGQTATIMIDGGDTKTAKGTITNVNPSADPQSRQIAIRIRVENPDKALRPGMFGKINFTSEAKKVEVSVPKEAISYKGKQATLAVVGDDNKVQIRNVTLGVSDDKVVEILDGVKAGEKVVILTYDQLKDGREVKVGTGKPDSGKGQGRGKGQPQGGANPEASNAPRSEGKGNRESR